MNLKKMTENGTLEGVSTLRFASFGPKGLDLEAINTGRIAKIGG